jgi:hypothetical protein
MKRFFGTLVGFGLILTTFTQVSMAGQRRRVVVRPNRVVVHRPAPHTRLVVHKAHPIRRTLPATVIVRTPRRVVTVAAPLVFLPRLEWRPNVVTVRSTDRLVWQDSERITSEEGWVDTSFGIDKTGNALFMDVNGSAGLNFAEVTFANGNVQVIDFHEQTHGPGVYKLLDFSDGRHVKTVRMLARSVSNESKFVIYLSR